MFTPSGSTLSATTLSGSTFKIAFIDRLRTTNAITGCGFNYGTITTSAPVYQASLQGVNSSGEPNGTILGGGSPASVTWTPGASDDNTWIDLAFTNSYSGSLGDVVALVIEYSSGTIGGANSATFRRSAGTSFLGITSQHSFPYGITANSGVWTKLSDPPVYTLTTASSVYGSPALSIGQLSNISTSGHRSVCKFKINTGGIYDTFTIPRFWMWNDWPDTGSDPVVGIWNAAGTAVQSWTVSRLQTGSLGGQKFEAYFSSPATLSAGTWYYAGMQASGVSCGPYFQTINSATQRLAYQDADFEAYGATWNGSAWTDIDTRLPAIELEVSAATAVSSGGIKIHPGMNGGFNG